MKKPVLFTKVARVRQVRIWLERAEEAIANHCRLYCIALRGVLRGLIDPVLEMKARLAVARLEFYIQACQRELVRLGAKS
jgi:hypothetical protein